MAEIIGVDCKLTVGTSTEVTKIKNVTLNIKADEVDITSRGEASASKWKGKRTGLLEWDFSGEMNRSQNDAGYLALRDAFLARTPLACVFSEPSGTGAETWTGSAYISEFPREEPLENVVTISIKGIGNGALTCASL